MKYRIEFLTAAARQIRKLPPDARRRIIAAISALASNPRPVGARKLIGEEMAWRIRIGDYRVIYDIIDQTLTITIVRAAHRSEAYNRR